MKKKKIYSEPECWNIPVEQCDVICVSFSSESLVVENEIYEW